MKARSMLLELLFTNLLMFLGMHDFILIKRRRIGCIILTPLHICSPRTRARLLCDSARASNLSHRCARHVVRGRGAAAARSEVNILRGPRPVRTANAMRSRVALTALSRTG